ncbi:MAG TPA: hypothetical protein VJB59_09880 [Bdellovibrionota bacterium]|nr:hypothetical protein [Bdellovibrionota bacterium]
MIIQETTTLTSEHQSKLIGFLPSINHKAIAAFTRGGAMFLQDPTTLETKVAYSLFSDCIKAVAPYGDNFLFITEDSQMMVFDTKTNEVVDYTSRAAYSMTALALCENALLLGYADGTITSCTTDGTLQKTTRKFRGGAIRQFIELENAVIAVTDRQILMLRIGSTKIKVIAESDYRCDGGAWSFAAIGDGCIYAGGTVVDPRYSRKSEDEPNFGFPFTSFKKLGKKLLPASMPPIQLKSAQEILATKNTTCMQSTPEFLILGFPGHLVVLDRETLRPLFEQAIPGMTPTAAFAINHTVFVGMEDGTICTYKTVSAAQADMRVAH